jgi:hypothetical protein
MASEEQALRAAAVRVLVDVLANDGCQADADFAAESPFWADMNGEQAIVAMLAFAAQQRAEARNAALDEAWQPIETAPKDEAPVLLACEFDGPGDWRIKLGGWSFERAAWHIFGASWKPSHWMPLPKPPQATP